MSTILRLVALFALPFYVVANPLPQAPDAAPPATVCTYSCSSVDHLGYDLVRSPGTISPASQWYSIYECKYAPIQWESSAHTCSYDKKTGAQLLAYEGDGCPAAARSCSDAGSSSSSPPLFSSQDEHGVEFPVETPPWIVNGRYQLWLKQHHT